MYHLTLAEKIPPPAEAGPGPVPPASPVGRPKSGGCSPRRPPNATRTASAPITPVASSRASVVGHEDQPLPPKNRSKAMRNDDETMKANKAAVVRLAKEVIEREDERAFRALMAPGFVDRTGAPGCADRAGGDALRLRPGASPRVPQSLAHPHRSTGACLRLTRGSRRLTATSRRLARPTRRLARPSRRTTPTVSRTESSQSAIHYTSSPTDWSVSPTDRSVSPTDCAQSTDDRQSIADRDRGLRTGSFPSFWNAS